MNTPTRLIALRPEMPLPSPSDEAELARQAASGRVSAQAELFRRHAPRLTALLTRLLGSTSDAEDAVQDTFLVAFRDLKQLRDVSSVGAWLRQIAVHQAHRRFRRRKLFSVLGLDRGEQDATLDKLIDSTSRPDLAAEVVLLERVVASLPTADRMAWMLRYVEGHELTEVAALCGCSLATAKRRIAAAHAKISRHVEIEEGADGEAA
jgi:RNA polymerase sigma-70 factor (ECF subfamily)